MEIFHVLGTGGNLKSLAMMQRPYNLLVSAWTYHHDASMRRYGDLIREKSGCLLVDSGFLSAAKAGKPAWAHEQELVLECAASLQADRVVMMDIPCSPDILDMAGLTPGQAMELTYRNAEAFDKVVTPVRKGFVNQGWTLAERTECQRTYEQMGVRADWWAVGSVAKRTPDTGLFDHVGHVRELVTGPLHCLGIANAAWVRVLREMGIDSCDSAAAALTNAFGKAVANGRQQALSPHAPLSRNEEMHSTLYLYNMMAIEHDAMHVPAKPKSEYQQRSFDL